MSIIGTSLGLLGLLGLSAVGFCVWQHCRYLKARREIVQDQQAVLYPSRTFHAVIYLKVEPGQDVIGAVRCLRPVLESPGAGTLVYAGQAALALVRSEQVENDWDAVLLVQYDSRQAFDAARERTEQREALASFERVYVHGLQRSALTNLMIPQSLLMLRATDILRRTPSPFPFVAAGDDAFPSQKTMIKELKALEKLRHLCEDAVVVFNLIKPGNAEQRAADRAYMQSMMSAMAERAHGPLHLGRAVTVEGDAKFSSVAVVYYPGIDHMQEMIGSTFMSRIGEGKQQGDSLAVVTVPFLSKL
jgi:hypothetical protein